MKKALYLAAAAAVAIHTSALAEDTFTVRVPAPAVPSDQAFTPPMASEKQLSDTFLVDTVGFVSARFQVNGISCFKVVEDTVRCDRGQQRVTVQVSTNGTTWMPLGSAVVWKNLPISDRLNAPITATGRLTLPASQRVTNLRFRVACDATKLGVEEQCPIVGDAIVQFYR